MDDQRMRLENYEVLKALYDFKATFAKTLSFKEGDHFILYQSNTKQRNWWQVINIDGQLGYIPSNYVSPVKIQPQFLIDFLDECITNLRQESNKESATISSDKQNLLLQLVERKRNAESSKKTKKQAPLPPDFANSTPTKEIGSSNVPRQTCSDTVNKISSGLGDICKSPPPVKIASPPSKINTHTAYQLLDQVRKNTQLSYEMSKVAVSVVISNLQQLLPDTVSDYFDAILTQLQKPLILSKLSIEETYDANRLKVIFTELTTCKEDSQQRNWMLYEDESIIIEYIKELTSILTNADSNVSRYVLRHDQYDGVTILVDYYQMEARWTIRQLLLQSFGVMCSLDSVILTIMLNSVLPMELARDMRSNPRNVSKLNYSSLLLTMIFSMGEPMPVTHLEQLGSDFITFLLDLIEDPPDTDLEEQIPDLFVNLILSYNLQFTTSENLVLNALKERTVAKVFTEKILFLFNREEDPVRIFDHQPSPPHSVLKLFNDLFSTEIIAGLFYTNDVKVLIDIILRQLFDVFPGDKRRQYLELCRRVLRTSNYDEHRHRSEDLLKCFTRIFCEESSESQGDQQFIRDISNEFPHLFKM